MTSLKEQFIRVYNELQETTYRGPKSNLSITVEVIRSFLQDLNGCWKHKFLNKKAKFPEKKILAFFSRFIEHDKGHELEYKVQKVFCQKLCK